MATINSNVQPVYASFTGDPLTRTVALNESPADGDVVFLVSFLTDGDSTSTSGGWTAGPSGTPGGQSYGVAVHARVWHDGDGQSFSVTHQHGWQGGNVRTYALFVATGVDLTDIASWDYAVGTQAAGLTVTAPGPNTLLLAGTSRDGGGSLSQPSGWTALLPAGGSVSLPRCSARIASAAGDYGPYVWNSGTNTVTLYWAAAPSANSGGGGIGDIQNALADWFDPSDATKPTSQPKLFPDLAVKLQELSDAAIDRLNTWSDEAVAALNDASSGANAWMGDVKDRLTGASGDGGSAFTGLSDQIAAIPSVDYGPQLRWLTGECLAPANRTLEETQAFSGQIGWSPGFPLFNLTIDATDDAHPVVSLGAAGDWYPGVGWWAPITSDGRFNQRHTLEFGEQWLWPAPRDTVGVVIFVHPAVTGTLRAYSVT